MNAIPDMQTPVDSEGAQLIIREAMKNDPRPLYSTFLGPLTDMASALLIEPRIADRCTVIWIGEQEHCLHCGNCLTVCPVKAVEHCWK